MPRRVVVLGTLVALSLSVATARAATGDGKGDARTIDRIVAVVNDDIILDSELDQLVSTQIAMRREIDPDSTEGKKAIDELRHRALDSLIESQLMRQQAAEMKLSVTGEEVDRALEEVKRQNRLDDATFAEALKQQGFTLESYRKNLKKQILELKVVNTAVRSRISVGDDEVRTFYNQNAQKLAGDTEAHLRMILIAIPPDAPAAEVERKKRTAQKVVELARAGRSFVELARAYSDDELTKAEGGDLGWVGKGVLVNELEEVMTTMAPGDVRGPVRSARGWHVLELVERKAGSLRPFDEVKEQIRRQLSEQQLEKAMQSWLKELRKKAHVDIRL
jgi:peptidyl-prolyl cis-trans isomerase SurA